MRLKKLRRMQGLTQKQLAEKANLNFMTIKNMEEKDYDPLKSKYGTLLAVAKALNITLEELLKD